MANNPPLEHDDAFEDPLAATLPPEQRVHLWLEQEGTPLEFQTASAFVKAGFLVVQGIHQQQPEGLPLEIDVVAFVHSVNATFRVGHDIIVECQPATHPWVAFAPIVEGPLTERPLENEMLEAARYVLNHRKAPAPEQWPAMPKAFAIKALHRRGETDPSFATLSGIVNRARLRSEVFKGKSWHITQMPLVVLGGDLCMAAWDESTNQITASPIGACVVDFRGDTVAASTQVQVVTMRALSAWLATLKDHIEQRAKVLSAAIEQVKGAVDKGSLQLLGLGANEKELPVLLRQLAESESTTRMLKDQVEALKRPRPSPSEGM